MACQGQWAGKGLNSLIFKVLCFKLIFDDMLLSILNIFFCISFIGFAYVNLNDKDSWIWVTIYMVAAICCGLAAFHYYYPVVYLVAITFYLVYAIQLFFARD